MFRGHDCTNFRKSEKRIFISVLTFLLNFSVELSCVKEIKE